MSPYVHHTAAPHQPRLLLALTFMVLATCVVMPGCGSKAVRVKSARQVTLSEFAKSGTGAQGSPLPSEAAVSMDAPDSRAHQEQPNDTAASRSRSQLPAQADANATAEATADIAPGSPARTEAGSTQRAAATSSTDPERLRPGERLTRPGDMIVVDSVVGQVSGRPIFADALLRPLAAQLRAQADQLSAQEFTRAAEAAVNEQLLQIVLNELFIAEAEASLTEEQHMGLFAFLRDLQEKTIATGQGSRLITEQRLLEEQGMTIEQHTEMERQLRLIYFLINKKIEPRVIVSWKDVQREYERRKAEFNPPGTVTLKWMRLSIDDDAELIETVRQRLAAGDPFDDVAALAPGGAVRTLDPLPIGAGGMADVQISDTFKPHLVGLSVGQTTGAIETGNTVNWLHVASIDQPPPQSLYQVQRQLHDELRLRREREERERYIRTLFAKGLHDELDEMSRRLLAVALLRYGK